jgi:hypothetical protein
VRPDPSDGDGSSLLEMSLHYGGTFGGGLVENLLTDEIEASRPRLVSRVAGVGPETT